jgi:zinc D-Ala-D-Ala carboxypeptidase
MQLSPHFSLEELTFTNHRLLDNTPDAEIVKNLTRLAEFLEKVRALVGAPIDVNSAYRSIAVNASVGGKPTSQHCKGCAADIKVSGMTPDQVVRLIKDSGLPFDQLIREFDAWTHVSIPNIAGAQPRGQVLIIDKTGTRSFI